MTATRLTGVCLLCLSLVACAQTRSGVRETAAMDIEFLYFDGCPVTPRMRANLEAALATMGDASVSFRATDLELLEPDDARLRYASPTVLVEGRDLMGEPPAAAPGLACRPYSDGLPAPDDIASRIRAMAGR